MGRRKAVEFVCEEDEERGYFGWRQAGQSGFDPVPGLGVAHDLLEHFPGGTDSMADEFQAFGAAMFVRYDGCYTGWSHNHSFAHHMSDLEDVLKPAIQSGYRLEPPPPTRPLEEHHERELERYVVNARKGAANACEIWGPLPDDDIEQIVTDSVGWIRTGYRRARRRYQRYYASHVARTFEAIIEKVDKFDNTSRWGALFEGMRIQVYYSIRRQEAYIKDLTYYG